MQRADLIIVGGGMAGLTLATALADSPLKLIVIDEKLPFMSLTSTPQTRVSAINQASEGFLRQLGIWQKLDEQRIQPYTHMQVWEQDSFARINFDRHSLNHTHLGHIIENQLLINTLWERLLEAPNVQLEVGSPIVELYTDDRRAGVTLANQQRFEAQLVVGTDGIHSPIRKRAAMALSFADYQQTAIVANVRTELPHQQCARQVFTPQGPLAFLPMADPHLCSIVWSQDTPCAQALMQQNAEHFTRSLYRAFDARLGHCQLESDRMAFPLVMRYARQWLKHRVVLAGDAAHSIHPLAGQGANLGLKDSKMLAEVLLSLAENGEDLSHHRALRTYERSRKAEAVRMIAAMQGFRSLFAGHHPVKKLLRGVGLSAVDSMPLVKDKMMREAAGL
ncbi:FAD-dependent monooxygenase [Lacimicrobium sp. SS2-24]|uniref:FAD-dependent monooxygenase n=1 Tax=Lacimicrobium sp. SS2-24 TaxID=2005569 RepID=UPI000B4A7920|nr:FAD-dependent monooxygenase [Lacimicrobium sp. SS2-24]